MNRNDLLNFGKSNGFTQISPGGIAGVWDDYVTLITTNGNGVGVTFSATVTASDKKALVNLNKLIKGYGLTVSGWNDKRVFFALSADALKTRKLSEYLDILVRCLRDVRAYPQLVCSVCGENGCDVMAIHGGEYARAHKSCIENEAKRLEISYAQEKENSKGGHLQGLPGAILGAFIGAFINVFITAFTGKIYSVAFLFVPVMAYLTYRKQHGITDGKGLAICGAVCVYMAYMTVCFNTAFTMWMADTMGFLDAFNGMLTYLFTRGGFVELTSKSLIYFAVTVCALFFTHKLKRPKKTPKIKPEDILKTMVKL